MSTKITHLGGPHVWGSAIGNRTLGRPETENATSRNYDKPPKFIGKDANIVS